MSKKLGYFSRDFILTIAGIICIGGLPALFSGISIDLKAYGAALKRMIGDLVHFSNLQYMLEPQNYRDLLPEIWPSVTYSLVLVLSALAVSFVVALAAGYFVALGGKKRINRSLYGVSLFEGIPDLFIILAIQLFVVWVYQKTEVLIFSFVASTDDKIYILPIILLSIIPSVHIFRILVQSFQEEWTTDYVTLAKSKGRSDRAVLLVHVVRNTLIALSAHLRPLIWILLSNLFVVEYMLGIHGITFFMTEYLSPIVITVSLLLLYFPFFIIFVAVDLAASRWSTEL